MKIVLQDLRRKRGVCMKQSIFPSFRRFSFPFLSFASSSLMLTMSFVLVIFAHNGPQAYFLAVSDYCHPVMRSFVYRTEGCILFSTVFVSQSYFSNSIQMSHLYEFSSEPVSVRVLFGSTDVKSKSGIVDQYVITFLL